MLVGHRIEYRRILDRFLDRPVELRRQTELRQHTVVDAVDLRLAVDLVGVILVHDRKSRRTGERIFAPPLVEQPVRIETAALDGQRTQIAVHETPRRPRRIGSRREERRRRIVIDDPQMPAPQDRSRLVDGRHDGIAALVGGLDDDLLLVGGVGYPRNETLRALPNQFGTLGRTDRFGGGVAFVSGIEDRRRLRGDDIAVGAARRTQVGERLSPLRHPHLAGDAPFAFARSDRNRRRRTRSQRIVRIGRHREFAFGERNLAPRLIRQRRPAAEISRHGHLDAPPPDRQGDLGIGRQRQFGIGHRRIVVAARCEKHCGTRQQRCRTSHEPKFFHRDKIYEIRCTIAVWANIRNIYRKTISPKGGRDTSEGRANGSFAGF